VRIIGNRPSLDLRRRSPAFTRRHTGHHTEPISDHVWATRVARVTRRCAPSNVMLRRTQ
jgi:hypothetical protein